MPEPWLREILRSTYRSRPCSELLPWQTETGRQLPPKRLPRKGKKSSGEGSLTKTMFPLGAASVREMEAAIEEETGAIEARRIYC
jgi:hypothetical protein